MSLIALLMVLVSAIMHAGWNLLVKKANAGMGFIWLVYISTIILFAPLAAYVLTTTSTQWTADVWITLVGNSVLHLLYYYLLNNSYRWSDLSLVYPLARGTGPLLATIYAIALLGERPSLLTLAGASLIGLGVLLLGLNLEHLKSPRALQGIAFALLTGITIAAYTIWDRHAVRDLALHPLLYLWAGLIGQLLLLSPMIVPRISGIRDIWLRYWKTAIAVAVLNISSYSLVLFALAISPISSIAPAREISILIAAAMGSRLLDEGHSRRRIAAALVMVIGLIALAFG